MTAPIVELKVVGDRGGFYEKRIVDRPVADVPQTPPAPPARNAKTLKRDTKNARRADRARKAKAKVRFKKTTPTIIDRNTKKVAQMVSARTSGWPIEKRNLVFGACLADVAACDGTINAPWFTRVTPPDMDNGMMVYSFAARKSVFVAREWMQWLGAFCPVASKDPDGTFFVCTLDRGPAAETDEFFFV
jgi:hypothetical protein